MTPIDSTVAVGVEAFRTAFCCHGGLYHVQKRANGYPRCFNHSYRLGSSWHCLELQASIGSQNTGSRDRLFIPIDRVGAKKVAPMLPGAEG